MCVPQTGFFPSGFNIDLATGFGTMSPSAFRGITDRCPETRSGPVPTDQVRFRRPRAGQDQVGTGLGLTRGKILSDLPESRDAA